MLSVHVPAMHYLILVRPLPGAPLLVGALVPLRGGRRGPVQWSASAANIVISVIVISTFIDVMIVCDTGERKVKKIADWCTYDLYGELTLHEG